MTRQGAVADASPAASELLERDGELSTLHECLETVRRSSRGLVVLVGPWFTSVYRIATSSDWIFRRGLAGAYPNHPPFRHEFLEEWERPFKVQGTLDAFRSMLQYGIQGFRLAQLRAVRVPALVLWGARDTVDSVSAGRRSAEALRAPFHLLPGAGHLSMLAAPAAIARAVESFARG